MTKNGILCLEGDWDDGLDMRKTVRPVLELLKAQWNIPFIHRTTSTRDEFSAVVKRWATAKYKEYPILYLAFLGGPGILKIGPDIVPITDLHELYNGGAHGRVIHFGACETIDTPKTQLRDFLRKGGFAGVCGYRQDIDWLEACALEVVVLNELSTHKIDSKGLSASCKFIRRKARSLAQHLEFKFYKRSDL